FSNDANARKYNEIGLPVTPDQITPSFVIGSSMDLLRAYQRPIHPVGDGTVTDMAGWGEFMEHAYDTAAAQTVSLWRYGVATAEMLSLLRDTPPRVASYVVEPGDSLSGIAAKLGTSVDALAQANGITNPNHITVGQRLVMPSGAAPAAA